MPFKSKAQARKLFATNPKVAKEFAAATPSIKALPERVKPHKARKLFQKPDSPSGPPPQNHLAEMSHHSRMKEHHERAAYHRNEAAHHERMFQMHRQMHEVQSVPQNPPGPAHPPGVTAEPSAKG